MRTLLQSPQEAAERILSRGRAVAEATARALVTGLLSPPELSTAVERGIRTSYDQVPIPDRRFDWCAYFDDYDGAPDAGRQPVGHGRTEVEAIYDLLCAMVE